MTPRRRRRAGYAFVAPVALFLGAVIVFPLVHAFWTSLHRVRGLNSTFIGADNYVRIFGDSTFWHSLGVSFAFTGSAVVLHHVAGLPYTEVGAALGSSEAAARRSAADGIAKLRTAYPTKGTNP